MKLRALLTKGEEIRFISHLDYASLIERALRRAGLPVAYSEGFNPHMKFSFASALAVGTTSEAEVMDVELEHPMSQPEAWDRLSRSLPPGVKLLRLLPYEGKTKSLMALVDGASYRIVLPYAGTQEAAERAIAAFFAAPEAVYRRVLPKKTREIDAKPYIREIKAEKDGSSLVLQLAVNIMQTGSLKPTEAIALLVENFGLQTDAKAANIHRTSLTCGGHDLFALLPADG